MAGTKRMAIIVAFVILCGLSGCSTVSDQNSVKSPSPEANGTQSESQPTDSNRQADSDYLTYKLDELGKTKGMFFVERDGVCTTLLGSYSIKFNADDWTSADGSIIADTFTTMYSGESGTEHALLVNRDEGDRLLTTSEPSSEGYGLDPIREAGYWPGFELNGYEIEEIDGQPSSPSDHGITVFNMHADGQVLGPNNYYLSNVWTTAEKSSFQLGYYEDTLWVEKTLNIDTSYYISDNDGNWINIPFEKTKDGYFILDISDVPAGLYNAHGSESYYLLNIV
ncbi:hypothetical protein [Arabiibacter massiliensis]|uniref:hypothetical protein n=1 Tax=Arabiibacter massiliensis TaxID=1870985 RepID=UPI00117AA16E|nr:hypothetical protein [Arabiibacter massiliensis]